jgi:Tctex-1 family.
MKKTNVTAPQNQEYQIKPKQREKFKPGKTKEIIRDILKEKLQTQVYHNEAVQQLTRDLAEEVKARLKEMNLPRYKYVVQVTIGEQKGQGVRVGCKCFWDFDTDYVASEVFQNDSIFCLCTVYAVYLY